MWLTLQGGNTKPGNQSDGDSPFRLMQSTIPH